MCLYGGQLLVLFKKQNVPKLEHLWKKTKTDKHPPPNSWRTMEKMAQVRKWAIWGKSE